MCDIVCAKCKEKAEKRKKLETKIKNLIEELNSELSTPAFLEKREKVMVLLDELEKVTD